MTEAEIERASVVAWLREGGTTRGFSKASLGLRLRAAILTFRRPWVFAQVECQRAAAAIERGEHLKEPAQ